MNSMVSGNTATGGGGIANYQSTLTLTNSTVSGNSSLAGDGGGISNYGSVLTLTNSTVSGNSSDGGNGGGISNKRFGNISGTLTIINSTISDNRAIYNKGYGGRGGGIFILGSQASITFCSIYGNGNASTLDGGGIAIEKDDHSILNHVVVRNSIIAANHAGHGPDISGNLTSYGYNLIEDISGATFDPNKQHLTDKIEVQFTNLRIDPQLADNCGLTQPHTLTHRLLPTSPAIDQIPFSVCRNNGISTDQRGVKRPQGSACDIGSYEYISS